jgi:DNA polymerase
MGIQLWLSRDAVAPAAAAPVGDPAPVTAVPAGNPTAASPLAGLDWDALEQKVSGCTACSLHATRTQTVFGVGNRNADWLFVGEAPGAEEDRKGEPFVGRAGQLLNAMLLAVGLKREQVYIANVLKCRPPENRDPQGVEVAQCEPYLHRQVELIQPKLIVAMGRFAAQSLLKTGDAIGRLRGQRHSYADTGIPLVVTYHPAYLLRSPHDKRKAWADLCLARRVLEESA